MHVEDCIDLDVRSLYKWSRADGVTRSCSWSRRGEEIAAIHWRLEKEGLDLVYKSTDKRSGKDELHIHRISTTWTPCHFGGERVWLVCPCGRRVAKIYLGPGKSDLFRCRHCYGLTNESRHNPIAARRNRLQAIRRKLGGSVDLSQPFPDRPKGMRRCAYARLLEEYRQIEANMTIAIFRQFEFMRPLMPLLQQRNS